MQLESVRAVRRSKSSATASTRSSRTRSRRSRIAQELPALELGSRLQPHDLDALAKCVSMLRGVDMKLRTLTDEMKQSIRWPRWRTSMSAKSCVARPSRRSGRCSPSARSPYSSAARPRRLYIEPQDRRARSRASPGRWAISPRANLSAAVEGVERGDEVGAMARALDTFKRNALELRAVEARAAEEKRRSDEAEAQRQAEQAARRKRARDGAAGDRRGPREARLRRISPIVSPTTCPTPIAGLQSDFNAAMGQLEAALGVVAGGARGHRLRRPARSPSPRTISRAAPSSRPRASRRPPPRSRRSPPR